MRRNRRRKHHPKTLKLICKAQRFARLLLDEIKLYNQVKVTEGRKNRDLYDRLKEDLDKSRRRPITKSVTATSVAA